MNATVIPHRPAQGGYQFTDVARMEWIKLRTLRSTGWITLILAAGMLGLAVLVMSHANYAKLSAADRASFDPTELGFVGLSGANGTCITYSAASISRTGMNRLRAGWRRFEE